MRRSKAAVAAMKRSVASEIFLYRMVRTWLKSASIFESLSNMGLAIGVKKIVIQI